MNGINVPNDGGDNVPPDPPPDAPVERNLLTTPGVYSDESPITKFKFQAKIDVNRETNDKTPLRLKALLIQILVKHQEVDPTFHLIPTENDSTASAITKATEIPNNAEKIKEYVKEMHDTEHKKNSKYYTVTFYIKVASSMTLGRMKKDNGLFMWLRNNNIFIRAFSFTTTYDVVTAGFISHMHGGIHNRDRINEILQKALKQQYPNLEVKMVPTTIKHGLDENKKRITHVVTLQADRKSINEAREALVHVFKLSANELPKEIFFVPTPANGMIKHELYYNLVNSHHENMANLRSFAVTGIANLQTPMTAQDSTDVNSSVATTFEKIILNAQVPGTEQLIFSSIEPTSHSETEGRYLLLTNKANHAAAEYMIDELLKYIAANPTVEHEISIGGDTVRRANQIKVSNTFHGYTAFLASKVPTTITTNPAQNAWNKRREPTQMDYNNDAFPELDPTKKARISNDDTNTLTTENSTEKSDSILVDFETEMVKEREETKKQMDDFKQEMANEIALMKKDYLEQINLAMDASERRMTNVFKTHISELMNTSEEAVRRIEAKSNEITDRILAMLATNGMMKHGDMTAMDEHNTTPRRKNKRITNDDVEMQENTEDMIKQVTPASHESRTQYGSDTSAGEQK